MRAKGIGIICEFNPLHNGHIHFINEVKSRYPDHVIILILNGYFLQRGEISIMTKEDKTRLALKYGIDIVVEHPAYYATQSADTFADSAMRILNQFEIEKLIFGSESDDIELIKKVASIQIDNPEFDLKLKEAMREGISYPAAIARALEMDNFSFSPNDVLGVAYTKSILRHKFNIEIETIKRTNDFHDNILDSDIVSASNIRERIKNGEDISKYVPEGVKECILDYDYTPLYAVLKMKILEERHTGHYLDVTEGIHNRLYCHSYTSHNYFDFIEKVKNKRITYTRLNRMCLHIILGMTKKDAKQEHLRYFRILGFNKKGRHYIRLTKRRFRMTHFPVKSYIQYNIEYRSSVLFELMTGKNVYKFEKSEKPILYDETKEQ